VKFLPVLLAAAMTAHAAPSDPGKAAIDFLEKVRQRKLDLSPGGDTALSPLTADDKKRQIARRLDRMARDLGSDPLQVGAVKLDENFAAVLVRKIGGLDPSRLQVFPVALVKRGAEWSAAPLPASFENVGAGYATALRGRLELLENWMLREQVVDLEKLREQSISGMRRKIEANLSAADLRNLNSKQVGERFLAACERGDLPSVLGFLGGLAAKLPEDWPARLKAADLAVTAGSQAPRPWRLLVAPEVARVMVHHEEEDGHALISIACLDPASAGPRIEVVHFQLAKGPDALWQIDPPARFLETKENPDDQAEDDLDSDLRDAFPKNWTATHPPKPQATAELARQTLLAELRNGNFQSLLAISKLDENPDAARKACIQAAQTWWTLHDPAAVRHAMPLAFRADESAAVAIFQWFSAREPDRFDARALYFEKSPGGWLWTPEPASTTCGKFQGWVDSETARWPDQWQQSLLLDCPVLEKIHAIQAPTKDDAQKIVEAWLDATRRGDVEAALRLVARLSDPLSGSAVLQNLGYEIIGSRRSKEKPVITGTYQGKTWTAVGMQIDQQGKSIHPLYPVVQTDRGPRIVIEIDLFASRNRGREFLNKAALERLAKSSSAAGELKTLCSGYQMHVEQLVGKAAR
jgi:hypothetical protein